MDKLKEFGIEFALRFYVNCVDHVLALEESQEKL